MNVLATGAMVNPCPIFDNCFKTGASPTSYPISRDASVRFLSAWTQQLTIGQLLMKFLSHIAFILLLIAGCSGRPGAVSLPDVDPATAANAAIEELDRNGDGQLSKEEWSRLRAFGIRRQSV